MAVAAVTSTGWNAIQAVCGIGCNYATYVHDLKENVPALRAQLDMLREKEAYVKQLVKSKETPHLVQAQAVKEWLHRVHRLYTSAEEAIAEGQEEIDHKLYRCFIPRYCCTFMRVGKKVNTKLEEVKQTIQDGEFEELVERRLFISVEEKPLPKTIGLDEFIDEIWESLEDSRYCHYGIYGMPGVGKTTVLKMLNNRFCREKHDYDKVIWIDGPLNDKKFVFQKIMRRKLEIPDGDWSDSADRESLILGHARMKKCILLIDDLGIESWDTIVQWGFPCLDGGHKIVFTANSGDMCLNLAQEAFKVRPLKGTHPELLFDLYAGQVLRAIPSIRHCAAVIVKSCRGHPLAIVMLGRVMARQTSTREWERIAGELKRNFMKSLKEQAGVFSAIEVNYNNLPDKRAKACFKYFSTVEDRNDIVEEEIIDLWYAEGLLGGDGDRDSTIGGIPGEYDIVNTRLEGERIIKLLKQQGLLKDSVEPLIKMHPVIRGTALWLERKKGKMMDQVWFNDEVQNMMEKNSTQITAKRIVLNRPEFLPFQDRRYSYPNLTTLSARVEKETQSTEFLGQAVALRVLNLCGNGFKSLPENIGQLTNLFYLRVANAKISLPKAVRDLKFLHVLVLNNIGGGLSTISSGIISGLEALQVFRISSPDYPSLEQEENVENGEDNAEENNLNELESLPRIKVIDIILTQAGSIQKLFQSTKLRRCIGKLRISDLSGPNSTSSIVKVSLKKMSHLESFVIRSCPCLKKVEVVAEEEEAIPSNPSMAALSENLREVGIWRCLIEDVTWLGAVKTLRNLEIGLCEQLKTLVIVEVEHGIVNYGDIFCNLEELLLADVGLLESICLVKSGGEEPPYSLELDLPCLEFLCVKNCPRLRKFPINPHGGDNLKRILTDEEWWENLEWDRNDRDSFYERSRGWPVRIFVEDNLKYPDWLNRLLKDE
ncbi:hypothetical protein Tsubulata_021164 [Turnera subulata]|uniref:NB-ARC domain-containing protein n=1 Tax=Turnera subulata TaxID=218843 RepID=A0A9Q0GFU8_9ROSI|nr:hypothetical protein Tsubulata_021164 [Turnera subulata]